VGGVHHKEPFYFPYLYVGCMFYLKAVGGNLGGLGM